MPTSELPEIETPATKVLSQVFGDNFAAYHGDCVEGVSNLPDESIGYSIFSPGFASLYTFSASERDFGNNRTYEGFFEQFDFLAQELFRVIKPGRLVSAHCMNIPAFKSRDGYIGVKDFRGDLIRALQKAGFIYHAEACIWRDPVIAMQRTKSLMLLHKQIVKDSCMSGAGLPDYLVTMRKPGENKSPVIGEFDEYFGDGTKGIGFPEGVATRYSIEVWQRYASPVWMDINPSDTLQFRSAREQADERHICPLQLQVIERGLAMWSNPGDTVLSPFAGIGSEGFVSIQHDRKFIGFELKESYFKQCVANLQAAELQKREQRLL